jgi:glyoxylase-like metal-dependent hydrolase (beta-lactamase superfamily II)
MSYHRVPGCERIYAVDAPMLGKHEVNSPYVLDTPEPAVLDTGPADGVDAIFDALAALDIDRAALSYIVPTHAHLDHAGGAGYLAEACENATVVCHENAVAHLTDEERLAHLAESVERAIGIPEPYGDPIAIDRERCRVVGGGETLDLGDRTLDVSDAPGHAPHQLCLFDRRADVLFSADAAGMHFGAGEHRPTTPPPDFDLEAAVATLERLETFDPETVLYAHFGAGEPGAGVAELHSHRELLPEYVEMIARARDEHGDDVATVAAAVDEQWHHWALATDVAGVLRYLDQREA